MSRCFPYPPPNYCKEAIQLIKNSGALELQREQETAKERRKEKKWEKKERKEKKDKSKDKSETSKHREHGHKKRKHEETKELQMNDCNQKALSLKAKNAAEQLEKSGLSEEHELPCRLSQEPCESFESTQNSSKSRKLEAANFISDNNGSIVLRLRMPLWKYNDQKPTPVNDEPCFSGRAIEAAVEQELCNNAFPPSNSTIKSSKITETLAERKFSSNAHIQSSSMTKSSKITEAPSVIDLGYSAHSHSSARIESCKSIEVPKEQKLVNNHNSSSGIKGAKKTEALAERKFSNNTHVQSGAATESSKITEGPRGIDLGYYAHNYSSATIESCKSIEAPKEQKLLDNAHIPSTSEIKSSKRSRKMERKFRDLIENWKPAKLFSDAEPEDLGWLSQKSFQDCVNVQSSSVSNVVEDRSHRSFLSCFQPRARYLPEFDMYQLPYTVPF